MVLLQNHIFDYFDNFVELVEVVEVVNFINFVEVVEVSRTWQIPYKYSKFVEALQLRLSSQS